MELLGQCVGTLMAAAPQLFDVAAAEATALAIRTSKNDQYKSDATGGILAVIGGHAQAHSASPDALGACTVAVVKLALSWQRDSPHFEGLQQSLSGFFTSAAQHPGMSQALSASVNERVLTPQSVQMLRTLY